MIRNLSRSVIGAAVVLVGADAVRAHRARAAAEREADEPPSPAQVRREQVVLISGIAQLAAGTMLAMNALPQAAAAVAAATLVPGTVATHRIAGADSGERADVARDALKNLALAGGLVIVAMDTEGQPGLAWRAEHLADRASREARWRKREATLLSQLAAERAKTAREELRTDVAEFKAERVAPAKQAVKDARLATRVGIGAGRALAATASTAAKVVGAAATTGAHLVGATGRGAKRLVTSGKR